MNLTRDEFCTKVFYRDDMMCVIPGCGREAVDPHHIVERRLFTDGDPIPWGYDIDNGASLCELHHKHAEAGYFPPQALRRWLKIDHIVLPAICKPNQLYDKWGNIIPSALTTHVKYPKTPYFNFSPSCEKGDRYIATQSLLGKPLSITVKKDGSCITISRDVCGARNGHEAKHASFDLLKQRHATIKNHLPENVQVFGEWLYATHSIHYADALVLRDYLEVFAVYDQKHQLFWPQDEVKAFCEDLKLTMVESLGEVMYEHEWQLVKGIIDFGEEVVKAGHEGLVVKSCYPYHYTQFADNAAKYVRPNHVQTDTHWTRMKIKKNEVA